MQPSTKALKRLRRSLGALTVGFMTVAGHAAQPSADEPGAAATTQFSVLVSNLEKEANAYVKLRPDLPRVIVIDIDQVNSFTRATPEQFSNKLYYYLRSRELRIRSVNYSSIRQSMGGDFGPDYYKPRATHITTSENPRNTYDVCVVSTETPDMSSRSLVDRWLGDAGPKKLQSIIDPGPYKMHLRAAWHEIWHCLDRDFVHSHEHIDPDHGLEKALAYHRSEMFADVAATLTMATKGDFNIIQQTADFRAIHSRWRGHEFLSAYNQKSDAEYYDGIVYYTTPAHDALIAHIQKVGLDTVKRYSMVEIQKVAAIITREHALDAAEFKAIIEYYKNGKGPSGQKSFVQSYADRANLARSRTVKETSARVIARPDTTPSSIKVTLTKMSRTEKQAVYTTLQKAITTAQQNGLTGQHGLFTQLDDWRKALHASPPQAQRVMLERKLYIAALLLGNGNLDQMLKSQIKATSAQPHP